jgi:hypothetical protein
VVRESMTANVACAALELQTRIEKRGRTIAERAGR